MDVTKTWVGTTFDCSEFGYMLFPQIIRPKSVGSVRLQSRSPFDHPLIDPNYLGEPEDLDVLVAAVKEMIRIGQQPPFDSSVVVFIEQPSSERNS